MPSAGTSRSRKVVTYAFRQTMLSPSVGARYAGGKPPRSHRREASPASTAVNGGKLQVRDPAGERFGRLADQLAGRAAENQVLLAPAVSIDQNPQQWKKLGAALDLVNDDQTLERLQGELGIRQPVEMIRIFEIEVVYLPFRQRGDVVTRQRGLATLAGAENPDHRVAPEQRRHARQEAGSVQFNTLKIESEGFIFQYFESVCQDGAQRGRRDPAARSRARPVQSQRARVVASDRRSCPSRCNIGRRGYFG